MPFDSNTSTTLLRRLRSDPADQSAWNGFVDRYSRMLFRWGRQWGLQQADAEDLTQIVLLEVARQMRNFVYDPHGSFRGWLKTIAYRSWRRLLDRRKRPVSGSDYFLDLLASDDAREDFLRQLQEESERELLETAMGLVRQRVQPHTWEAFRLTAFEHLSGAEAGTRLGMKPGAVLVARSKVQKMIQQEVQRMDEE